MKGKRKNKDPDIDLASNYVQNYVSDSDDDLGHDGKMLLERAKHGRYFNDENQVEVLRVHSSSEDEDDDYQQEVGSDFDSDIEGKEQNVDNLPSTKAWGSKKTRYYNTDYVDKDYGGFQKDEEKEALMEEEEAEAIQRRLMAELDETDFTMGLLSKVEEKKAETARRAEIDNETEKIQTDLSKLSKEEKIQFLRQNSPEFFPLIEDFKKRMEFAKEKIVPILGFVESGKIPTCKASSSLHLYYSLILSYCSNITFYLLARCSNVKQDVEPVLERLLRYRKLLLEMDKIYDRILEVQVDGLLDAFGAGDEVRFIDVQDDDRRGLTRAEKRRKKRNELDEEKMVGEKINENKRKLEGNEVDIKTKRFQESSESSEDEAVEGEEETRDDDKRGITYKMAKNKGLVPKKKKELRNPRVKHRNKFRKAKIRRRGQVREVRREINKYGGEISGVKAYVRKSIKLK